MKYNNFQIKIYRGEFMIKYIVILLFLSLGLFAESNITKEIFEQVSIKNFPNIKKSKDKMSQRERNLLVEYKEAKQNYMVASNQQPKMIKSLIDLNETSNKENNTSLEKIR